MMYYIEMFSRLSTWCEVRQRPTRGNWRQDAQKLAHELAALHHTSVRVVVYVDHGGLVVQQIIYTAEYTPPVNLQEVFDRLYGIL